MELSIQIPVHIAALVYYSATTFSLFPLKVFFAHTVSRCQAVAYEFYHPIHQGYVGVRRYAGAA